MNLLLPDALDSKLIDVGSFDDDNSLMILLRLRLYVLMQILFGGRILVPEGWALDSMSFLWVGSEVVDAIRKLSKPGSGLKDYSPFLMETRRDGNYITILREYMQRPDVRWSGFRPVLDDPKKREYTSRKLNEIIAGPRQPIGTDLSYLFADVLGREDIANAIGTMSDYFSIRQAHRTVRTNVDTVQFQKTFHSFFEVAKKQARSLPYDEETARLIRFYEELCAQGISFRNSSMAMRYVDNHAPQEIQRALMRIIDFTYKGVTTQAVSQVTGVHPDLTTPPLSNQSSKAEWITDEIISSRGDSRLEQASIALTLTAFSQDDLLVKKLGTEKDWIGIWESAIGLSLSEKWNRAVTNFTIRYNREAIDERVLESHEFRSLADILEDNVPSLTLRQCHYCPFSGDYGGTLGQAIYTAMGAAVGGGVGAGLAAFLFPPSAVISTAMAGSAIGTFISKLPLPRTLDLNPASKTGLFSSRTTALDLFQFC